MGVGAQFECALGTEEDPGGDQGGRRLEPLGDQGTHRLVRDRLGAELLDQFEVGDAGEPEGALGTPVDVETGEEHPAVDRGDTPGLQGALRALGRQSGPVVELQPQPVVEGVAQPTHIGVGEVGGVRDRIDDRRDRVPGVQRTGRDELDHRGLHGVGQLLLHRPAAGRSDGVPLTGGELHGGQVRGCDVEPVELLSLPVVVDVGVLLQSHPQLGEQVRSRSSCLRIVSDAPE